MPGFAVAGSMVCHTGEGETDVPNLHKQPRIGQVGLGKWDWDLLF